MRIQSVRLPEPDRLAQGEHIIVGVRVPECLPRGVEQVLSVDEGVGAFRGWLSQGCRPQGTTPPEAFRHVERGAIAPSGYP